MGVLMSVKHLVRCLLASGLAIFCTVAAHASVAPIRTQNTERGAALKLSDLRSAYLLRAGYVRYDAAHQTPAGIQQQLRNHFDVVIGVLHASTPRSMDAALARLELSTGRSWTNNERAAWRRQLTTNRYVQILRLAAYRDRGLFPLNEGQAARPVPIFVDRHDTACAVGHLMRLSGWQRQVAAIERGNNLVYVPDAARSEVARWALTSGITLEEAALVQPGYAGFNTPALLSNFEPGEATAVAELLRYENFQLEIQNFQLQNATFHQALDNCADPDNCANLIPGAIVTPLEPVGFDAGVGLLPAVNDVFNPAGNHWIVLGGVLYPPGPFMFIPDEYRRLRGETAPLGLQRLKLQFDVTVLDPNGSITEISQISYPTYDSFGPIPIGTAEYEMTTVAIDGGPVGTAHFEELPDTIFAEKVASSNLPGATQLTVSTTIWLYNGARVNSFVIGFQVIPEPNSLGLGLAGALGLVVARRSRKRLR